jgi:hypothetical protein
MRVAEGEGAGTRVAVCDCSLHATNGSANPTLTIVAKAIPAAEHLGSHAPDHRLSRRPCVLPTEQPLGAPPHATQL